MTLRLVAVVHEDRVAASDRGELASLERQLAAAEDDRAREILRAAIQRLEWAIAVGRTTARGGRA